MRWPAAMILLGAVAGCDLVFPPGEQVPDDAGTRDASGDAADDADHDGVPDELDNCKAIANHRQHDEDHDSVGDACDNCPHVVNADQANADALTGDGLGDACGDSPTTVDCVAFFTGFGTDAGWEPISGTWSVADDAITQTDVNAGQALVMSTITIPDGLVYAYVHIDQLAPPPAANNVGVWGHSTYTAPRTFPDGYLVEEYFPTPPATATYVSAVKVVNDGVTDLGIAAPVAPEHLLAAGDIVTPGLDLRSTLGWIASVAVNSSGASLTFAAGAITSGRIGLRTNQVVARFDFALVFTQPAVGPCPPGSFPD